MQTAFCYCNIQCLTLTLTLSICLTISIYTTPTTLAYLLTFVPPPIPTYKFEAHSRHMLKTFTSGEKANFSSTESIQDTTNLTKPSPTWGKNNPSTTSGDANERHITHHLKPVNVPNQTKPNHITSHHQMTYATNPISAIEKQTTNTTTQQHNNTGTGELDHLPNLLKPRPSVT